MAKQRDLEDRFWKMLEEWGIQGMFVRQYVFAKEELGRQWKFDFCNPTHMVAVEIEGGIFQPYGAHKFGPVIADNMEKYNEGTAMGYRIFRFGRVNDMKGFYNLYAVLLETDYQKQGSNP